MKIPFLDLTKPHQKLKEELLEVFSDVLMSGRFIGGPVVENFEKDFATFCNTNYCIGVSSGTDALRFALIAAEIEKESIVITVPNTFIATTEAISQAGAIPDFVDINEQTYTIDPEKLHEYIENNCDLNAITGRPVHRLKGRPVSAIIPVHLYGQMADMDPIMDIAQKYNLTVIEDACQAHGAQYFSSQSDRWEMAGSMGLAAAFSFYPGKILGACGEAGAITTNNEALAKKTKMLRDHGQLQKYYHEIEGYNGRLDAVQAGILGVKLKHIDDWVAKRRKVAAWYNEMLKEIKDVITPFESDLCKNAYHLYIVRTQPRDELMGWLATNTVDVGLHYPIPLHKQHAYRESVFSSNTYPIAEKVSGEILSLPIFPELSRMEVSYVCDVIHEFFSLQKPSLEGKTSYSMPSLKEPEFFRINSFRPARKPYES